MIRLKSPLWIWKGESAGSWHFLTIAEEYSSELRAEAFANHRGFGSVRVRARIGQIRWKTSVFPARSGGFLLPVKAEVRRRAGLVAGDEVTVEIETV